MSLFFFFFKQKTAYEMRISDWSSDVCSSDLRRRDDHRKAAAHPIDTRPHDSGPGRFTTNARRQQKPPHRTGVISRMPVVAECVAALRYGSLEMAIPRIDETRRQPPLHEKNGRASCRERVCQSV